MPSETQMVRLWGLLRLLGEKPDGLSVKQISDRMGQSKSTVVRDINKLVASGFAISTRSQKNKRIYSLSTEVGALRDVDVTSMEMLALYAVRALMAPLAGSPIYDSLETLFSKLHGAAQRIGNGRLDIFPHVYMAHTRAAKSYVESAEIIDVLVDAIVRRRVLTISYEATGKRARTHHAKPLRLFFNMGGLYCLALLGERKAPSTLAVERIQQANPTSRRFRVPKGLDLAACMNSVFGVIEDHSPQPVVARFTKRVAPYIRARTWHPSQTLTDLPGGGVEWTCTVQGKEEVFAWLLSRGPDAELVSPASWRNELMDRTRRLADIYAAPAP